MRIPLVIFLLIMEPNCLSSLKQQHAFYIQTIFAISIYPLLDETHVSSAVICYHIVCTVTVHKTQHCVKAMIYQKTFKSAFWLLVIVIMQCFSFSYGRVRPMVAQCTYYNAHQLGHNWYIIPTFTLRSNNEIKGDK